MSRWNQNECELFIGPGNDPDTIQWIWMLNVDNTSPLALPAHVWFVSNNHFFKFRNHEFRCI